MTQNEILEKILIELRVLLELSKCTGVPVTSPRIFTSEDLLREYTCIRDTLRDLTIKDLVGLGSSETVTDSVNLKKELYGDK